MVRCIGCGKLGRMGPRDGSMSSYEFSLLLSPVVSVWDCIVRKMRATCEEAKEEAVKDELDRLKQAEKKKRRLEKALATSAAIISELEKKKEEQQRLDEEGTAVAEAVALHVLIGENSDDSCKVRDEGGCKPWNCNSNLGFFLGRKRACFPHLDGGVWSVESMGWVSDAYIWDGAENGKWSFSFGPFEKNVNEPIDEKARWGFDGFSADIIAAQAVSSLQIAEDAVADEGRLLF